MHVTLSQTSEKPIYQQLYDQISAQIIRGELTGEEGLPPIRTVARELRVSIITVKKAWEQLERDGLIYTVVGRGCFVQTLSREQLQGKRSEKVRKSLTRDIQYYREMGLSLADLLDAVKKVYGDFESDHPIKSQQ